MRRRRKRTTEAIRKNHRQTAMTYSEQENARGTQKRPRPGKYERAMVRKQPSSHGEKATF